MVSFKDLRREIGNGVGESSGPYCCYLGNADSQFPPPRRFTYRGCTAWKYPRVLCQKSIEGYADLCEHNPTKLGNHAPMYRFDLLLFDAIGRSPPIVATVFSEAEKLLQMPADEFANFDDCQQGELLHEVTFKGHMYNVWMKSQGRDRKPIVTRLETATAVSINSPEKEFLTPSAEFSRFMSPPSTSGSGRGGVSTSSATVGRRQVVLDEETAQKVQRSLADAMSLIAISKSPIG